MIPLSETALQKENLAKQGVNTIPDDELVGINNSIESSKISVESPVLNLGSQLANKHLMVLNLAATGIKKEDDSNELIRANIELGAQYKEKGKRAAELIIANKELVFQNREKEKRAAELIIANNELVFQNEEKEKRAAELIIANNELVFQNTEKEKRAAELIIANKELVFQYTEKEKRAAELTIANKELVFENLEKEKRAAELLAAYKELDYQTGEKEKQAAENDKRAKELEEAIRELESFSYSVSHDLRAPLRAINGFTKVLVEDFQEQLNEEANELLVEIIASSNKMGELIDNLLEFSRIGKQQVNRTEVDVDIMVNKVIAELTAINPNGPVKITMHPLQNIQADRNMLKQVFINLVSNAIKYSGKETHPVIEIGSYPQNDFVTYYVKDNGVGFDMRYYDKLFGVFQRLHSSTEFEGTGVGLAIIHKIVTKHEGKVWAEGKVNKGACFFISLPVF